MAIKKKRQSSHIFDNQVTHTSALDDEEDVEEVKPETNQPHSGPSPQEANSQPSFNAQPSQLPKKKELVIGETLLGTTKVKINNQKYELEIYYGNFVKPMIYNDKTEQYEFKTYKYDQYINMLNDFLNTLEGLEYKPPTKEEIEEACKIVREKERAYLDKLKNAQQKPASEEEEPKQEETPAEEKSLQDDKGEQSPQDKQEDKELNYCGNVKSYKYEQMAKYKNKGFNADQLEQISLGLDYGINVGYYAFVENPASSMEQARKQLQYDMDISRQSEAKRRFNQDYSDEKEKLEKEVLEKEEEPEKPKEKMDLSGLKKAGTAASSVIAIVIIGLITVALCIVIVTILLQAFKEYTNGLFR